MGTKNNPSKFDCYAKAQPDEPIFILLARDPLAAMLVRKWAEMRHNADQFKSTSTTPIDRSAKVKEALACADAMDAYWLTLPPEKK